MEFPLVGRLLVPAIESLYKKTFSLRSYKNFDEKSAVKRFSSSSRYCKKVSLILYQLVESAFLEEYLKVGLTNCPPKNAECLRQLLI